MVSRSFFFLVAEECSLPQPHSLPNWSHQKSPRSEIHVESKSSQTGLPNQSISEHPSSEFHLGPQLSRAGLQS